MKSRVLDFIYEMEKKYKNKSILVVSHEAPMKCLMAGIEGFDDTKVKNTTEKENSNIKNAEILESFRPSSAQRKL